MRKLTLFFILLSGMSYGQLNIVRSLYQFYGDGHPTNVKSKFSGLAVGCHFVDRLTDSVFTWQTNQTWVFNPHAYGKMKGDKGDPGANGATPTLQTGNVITLPPGSPATMIVRPLGNNSYAIDMGIPQGQAGSGSGGSVARVNTLYELYTTMNFVPTMVGRIDGNVGGPSFWDWQPGRTDASIVGDIVNRGSGCFVRVGGTRSGELYNTAWAGKQDIPYRSTVGSISSYPNSMTQAQVNIMFGSGYDVTKDTYDYLALQYAESIRSKAYYAVIESPASVVYQINRTVKPTLNYETLPGHWVGDVSGDRRTVGSNFGFIGNYSTVMFNHSNGGTMISDAYKDFNLLAGNANARTSNWENLNFWGSSVNDTGLYIGCANNNLITGCVFSGLQMGLHIGFGMHSKVINNEFADIRGVGCQWDWQSIANGSPSASPCNGSIAYGNHIVGGVGGKYGFVSYESDGSHWDRTSGEGAGTGVSMISMFHIEGKSSTCKGGNIDGIRAEAHYQKGIVELDVNESNWDVSTVWSQANNVMIDLTGNGSAVTTFRDGKYPDGSALKFRLHSAFTNIKVDQSFNTWSASQVQYMTDLGGAIPNPDRQDIRGFRYQNWQPTGLMARASKSFFGKVLLDISPLKTKEDESNH